MIKLIASDLDGTLLLGGSQELDTRIFHVIRRLKEKGILFVAASGRQYPNLKRLFAPVGDDIAFICENGALVMYKGQVLAKSPIDRQLGLELMEDIWKKEECEILLSGQYTSYLKPKSIEYVRYLTDVVHVNVMEVNDMSEVKEEFLKISVYDKRGVEHFSSPFFTKRWDDRLKLAYSGYEWMDFTATDVNKGNALRNLQGRFAITKAESMAFGDNYNDIEMLKMVAYDFAMEQGKPEIKAMCNYSTGCVEDTIEEFLL